MKASLLLIPVLLVAACGDEEKSPAPAVPSTPTKPAPAKAPDAPPEAGGPQSKTPAPQKREMPRLPPLTADVARKILRAPLDSLGGDDTSRRTLLYLADLGDRVGVDAARKLCAVTDGKFSDLPAAAVGAETLLAYGEADGAAKAVAIAKQYEEEEEPIDEYILHALGRVQGGERAQAATHLVRVAQSEDEDDQVASIAVGELGRAAKESAATFAKIAADKNLGAMRRGAAVAGLLHAGDSRGKQLADQLVKEATASVDEPADGAAPEAASDVDPPAPEDVILGLGVEGATEAAPVVKQALERLIPVEDTAFAGPQAAKSLVRIYSRGDGAEMRSWLADWAKRDDTNEVEISVVALAFGDDGAAPVVAKYLEDLVSMWSAPTASWEDAIDILDVVARRGVATSPAFREIVDSAAQVHPDGKGGGSELTDLNVAAAHAYLKSTGK